MEPNKPWVGLGTPCNDKDKLLFAVVTTIKIGNGAKASFWYSAWIQGRRPKNIAPTIFNFSKHKNKTVQEALTNNIWVRDINLAAQLSVTHLQQFFILWGLITAIPITPEVEDTISWKLTRDGLYTTASAYRAQFYGMRGEIQFP